MRLPKSSSSRPPAISTWPARGPLVKNVVVCSARGSIEGPSLKELDCGSYNSVELRMKSALSWPPETKISPAAEPLTTAGSRYGASWTNPRLSLIDGIELNFSLAEVNCSDCAMIAILFGTPPNRTTVPDETGVPTP